MEQAVSGIESYADVSYGKQREFHRLCRALTEVHFTAGRQSGKTTAGAAELVRRTVLEPVGPKADYLISAPIYDQVLNARFHFQELLPWGTWTFLASQKRYTIRGKDGALSNVWIRNADQDAARGLTLDGAWIDEAAFCPPEFFDNLRPALAARNGSLWTTSTPRGRNHAFQMYDPLPDGVGVVFAESLDNPAFSQEQWDAAIRRYGFDSPFFQQEHRGIAAAFVGQAVPQFAEGIIAPATWHQDWTTVVGLDPGWTAGTGALLAQISPDEDVIIWGFKYWTETPRHVIVGTGLGWPWVDRVRPIYAIDPAGSSGRAPEAGDIGWQHALEQMQLDRHGSTLIDVRWNRLIGESASLMMIRSLAHQHKITIAEDARTEIMGSPDQGAHAIQRILQGASLSKNIEKDQLDASHPESEALDSLRYILVNCLPHLQAGTPITSRHEHR